MEVNITLNEHSDVRVLTVYTDISDRCPGPHLGPDQGGVTGITFNKTVRRVSAVLGGGVGYRTENE